MMWRIKQLADPDSVLSPGIVLNRDPKIHVADLKSTPAVEDDEQLVSQVMGVAIADLAGFEAHHSRADLGGDE